ncbi:MAG: cohesin domain-containing protein [Desulfobacter sp.]
MFKKIVVVCSFLFLCLHTGAVHAEISETKIVPADGGAGALFGQSMDSEANFLVIGADADGIGGSAYIYKKNGDAWTEILKLTADDNAPNDRFGIGASISGDYMVIGAQGVNNDSGAAYIFKRDGETWSQQAKLTAADAGTGDLFGYQVGIDGEYVVVGSYLDDQKGTDAGAAYIFKRDGATWSQQAKLTASDGAAGNHFGASVSISIDRVVIGKPGRAAYIFSRDGTTWTQEAMLSPSDGASQSYVGYHVAIDGEYAIVGTHNNSQKGAAYIFKRNGAIWYQQAKLTAGDGVVDDLFGQAVSIEGKYAVIGAYGANGLVNKTGATYVFQRSGEDWTQQTKLTAFDGATDDFFGVRVQKTGTYALVGAYKDDDKGASSGSVYVYDLGFMPDTTVSLSPDNPAPVVGDTLCINVDIADADGLYSAAFDLTYDPGVLMYQSASEGDFFNADSGATFFNAAMLNGDASSGIVVVGVSRVADIGGISGSGTIAQVCFNVISGSGTSISVGLDNGYFEGIEQGIAIEVTEGSDPAVPVGIGVPANLIVTDPATLDQLNLGWDAVPDALEYQVYRADASGGDFELLGTTTGTSYEDSTCILADVTYYYAVKAVSPSGLTSELSAEASGKVTGLQGDINKDNRIDGRDLTILARAFNTAAGDVDYDCQADLNRSDVIDGDDLVILAAGFGNQL